MSALPARSAETEADRQDRALLVEKDLARVFTREIETCIYERTDPGVCGAKLAEIAHERFLEVLES